MPATISGAAVTVQSGSMTVEDRIGERSMCRFTVIDRSGSEHYQRGQQVTATDFDGNTLFSGYIATAPEVYSGADDTLFHQVSCMDNHYLADKRVAKKAYQDTSADAIVLSLTSEYLEAEGVTVGNISTGPTFTAAVFNYIPVSRAMQLLADRTGYWWRIDHDKQIHFEPPNATPSTWNVGGSTDVLSGTVEVERANPLYRNTQYIRGGRDVTDVQTEIMPGDGETVSFPVGFPIAKVPTVSVNLSGTYSSQTVGIKGVETGKDWYWNKNDAIITQESTGVTLTSTQLLKVEYEGFFTIIAKSNDPSAVIDRQTIEGGSGIVEDVQEIRNVEDRSEAFELASESLDKYAHINTLVRFGTTHTGLEPGQEIEVTLPKHGLSAEKMLIESVRAVEGQNSLKFYISAADNPSEGSWARFFETLVARSELPLDPESIYEDEILAQLEDYDEGWTWGESLTQNVFTCATPSTSLFPESTLYPC